MRLWLGALLASAALSAGCHPGPIGSPEMQVGGTIAGIVKTSDSSVPVPGRRVAVVDVATGTRLDTTTGANGGYTIQVPVGTYRIDVELQSNETLARQPRPTHVNNGDLDASRDFVIIARAADQTPFRP